MIRKLLLFSLFCVFTRSVSAQDVTLTGRVTGENNEPIPFASVYVQNTSYGTTANENGNYELKLTPGSYKIVYRFVGYKLLAKDIVVTSGSNGQDVTLIPDPYVLQHGSGQDSANADAARLL